MALVTDATPATAAASPCQLQAQLIAPQLVEPLAAAQRFGQSPDIRAAGVKNHVAFIRFASLFWLFHAGREAHHPLVSEGHRKLHGNPR